MRNLLKRVDLGLIWIDFENPTINSSRGQKSGSKDVRNFQIGGLSSSPETAFLAGEDEVSGELMSFPAMFMCFPAR